MSNNNKSKTEIWFDENVNENLKELKEIGEIANRQLQTKLNMSLASYKTVIALYCKIFECICDEIAEKESEWDSFTLNVANRFKIGYTTTNDEEDEKVGNFMVFIQHIKDQIPTDVISENEEDDGREKDPSIEICAEWNSVNVKTQSDVIKSIAARAKKVLSEIINIKLDSHEFIIPMFCVIHDTIIRYIIQKKAETKKDEYEINIAGLYSVGVQDVVDVDEEDESVATDVSMDVYYHPEIALKLRFKSDQIATGKDE
jgi:hypothetical protein